MVVKATTFGDSLFLMQHIFMSKVHAKKVIWKNWGNDGQNRLIPLQCLQLVMWNINEKFFNAVLSEKFASLVLQII